MILVCSYLFFRYLAEEGIDPSKNRVIKNGTKIIHLEAQGVTLKDSYCYLAMPLAKFPASFDLKEMAKGHFPHFFNTPENSNYIGTWPDKKHYGPDKMKTASREKFLRWYDEQKHKVLLSLLLCAYIFSSFTRFSTCERRWPSTANRT